MSELSLIRNRGTPWLRYISLGVVALVMLYPMLWLIGASFKSNSEIFTEAGFWPSRFDFGAYAKGWKTSTSYNMRAERPVWRSSRRRFSSSQAREPSRRITISRSENEV